MNFFLQPNFIVISPIYQLLLNELVFSARRRVPFSILAIYYFYILNMLLDPSPSMRQEASVQHRDIVSELHYRYRKTWFHNFISHVIRQIFLVENLLRIRNIHYFQEKICNILFILGHVPRYYQRAIFGSETQKKAPNYETQRHF